MACDYNYASLIYEARKKNRPTNESAIKTRLERTIGLELERQRPNIITLLRPLRITRMTVRGRRHYWSWRENFSLRARALIGIIKAFCASTTDTADHNQIKLAEKVCRNVKPDVIKTSSSFLSSERAGKKQGSRMTSCAGKLSSGLTAWAVQRATAKRTVVKVLKPKFIWISNAISESFFMVKKRAGRERFSRVERL